MTTVKEQREIIEAYERGEEIEWKSKYNSDKGFIIPNSNYEFDFQSNEYRIKPKRWRAEKDDHYYFINPSLEVKGITDAYGYSDDDRFNVGNYFRTVEQAKKAREFLKECLTKFHEE